MEAKLALRALMLAALLLLVGCSDRPVAEDMTQRQANRIVAVLNQHGISAVADRGRGGRARYTVSVESGVYSQAVAILHERGLLEEPEIGFRELVAQQGLIPSSRKIEALRLDHAIALELEETLRSLPGIEEAKVLVRLHSVDRDQSPGVSVVVQHLPEHSPAEAELLDLVQRGVPGVEATGVHLAIHQAPSKSLVQLGGGVFMEKGTVVHVPLVPFLAAWRVPEDDYVGLALTLVGCLLGIGAIGGLIGFWFGYYKKSEAVERTAEGTETPRILGDAGRSGPKSRKLIGSRPSSGNQRSFSDTAEG